MTPRMGQPFTLSMVLHVVVLVIAVGGLPYLKPDIPVIEDAISVEFVPVADKNQTDKPPARSEKADKSKEGEKVPKPMPPQVTSEAPPKPTPPKPPEKLEDVTMPDDVANPDAAAVKAPVIPPKPIKRPVLTQTEDQEAFKSLLRNLMPAQTEESEQTVNTAIEGEQPSPMATLSQQMTISEMEAVKEQLSECWKIQAGARYAEDLAVDVKLFMNPDRTVRESQIMDGMRYNNDSFFRAAADSAMRAIRNPYCSPLRLPPDKYDQWKTIEIRFDPRDML